LSLAIINEYDAVYIALCARAILKRRGAQLVTVSTDPRV
jgi:hypothetical protein